MNCASAMRDGFTESASRLVTRQPEAWTIASVVASELFVERGKLSRGNLFNPLRARLCRYFASCDCVQAIGGFDVSLNEGAAEPSLSHWQPHAWIFIRGTFDDAGLRLAFPASDSVPRPVRLLCFDGNIAALDYALKPNFVRRQSLGSSESARRNTRHRPLRVEERSELALELHRAGLAARVFLSGISFDRQTYRFSETPS